MWDDGRVAAERCELWGKLGRDGRGWYPLEAHLGDTAAAAGVLWDRWLAPNLRGLFTEMLGGGARERFALVAAAHDIGKANPLFQLQLGVDRVPDEARKVLSRHQARLEKGGFPVPGLVAVRGVKGAAAGARHEVFSQYLAEGLGFPGWAAAALGGHHGRYPRVFDDPFGSGRHLGVCGGGWGDAAGGLVDELRAVLGVSGEWPPLGGGLVPGVVAVSGAVSLADWLASADESVAAGRVAWADCAGDLGRFVEARRVWFEDRLAGMVGVADTPAGPFGEVFGFEPNGTQRAVAACGDAELVVVMSPMGDGKTEAALARHQRLGRGLYFGLPTMATADAMFARVQRFFQGHGQAGVLAHSRAMLNSFYDAPAAEVMFPEGVYDDDGAVGLTPGDWFRGRHRALLAPVAVGTCDQALAASLPHRWVTMRLLGLANKHLVLDEVHTYDAYQDELLAALLGWMGVCGAPVTLLSATLPQDRLRQYLDAWGRGRTRFAGTCALGVPAGYPSVVHASVAADGGVVAGVERVGEVRGRVLPLTVASVPGGGPVRGAGGEARAAAIAELVGGRWAPGRSVGVICNTVDGSIAAAEAIEARLGAAAEVVVVHSRMLYRDRRRVEERVVAELGRGGAGGLVVVGTQVLEASLDVDFDVLVTELAPAAALLQRSGRLWRHSTQDAGGGWGHPAGRAASRPGRPELVVVCPEEPVSDMLPYTAVELNRARGELEAGEWSVPEGLQGIVDRCWVTLEDLVNDPSPELEQHLSRDARRALAAGNVRLDWAALAKGGLGRLPGVTETDMVDESARTRLVESPTATVVIVGPGAYDGPLPVGPVGLEEARKLLECSLPVSGRARQAVLKATTTDLSPAHPLLRGVSAVTTESLTAGQLELDPRFGLRWAPGR